MSDKIINESFVDELVKSGVWKTAKIDVASRTIAESTEEAAVTEEPVEEISEEVEGHVCPLCESHLEQDVEDDRLYEFIDEVYSAVVALDEANEEDDDEELVEEYEDEDEE